MNDKNKNKPPNSHTHFPNLEEFKQISKRLQILEKWTELAIRPPFSRDCPKEDLDLYVNDNKEVVENEEEVVDDIPKLQQRCLQVRQQMNSSLLPPFPYAHPYEEHLKPKPSQIPNAGLGLFYCPPSRSQLATRDNSKDNDIDANSNGESESTFCSSSTTTKDEHRIDDSHECCYSTTDDHGASKDEITHHSNDNTNKTSNNTDRNNQENNNIIPPGQVLCYYTGHRHTYQSSKSLKDTSYLFMVGNSNGNKVQLGHGHDDDDELQNTLTNDDCNDNYNREEEWEDDDTTTTVFVDPGPLPQIKARYINDPINPTFVNCQFVPGLPHKYSCAVVSTKSILPQEELFISYGDLYSWSSSSSTERQSMSFKYLRKECGGRI